MIGLKASAHQGLFTDPVGSHYDRSAIGLALSGGGYRATLFHAGAIIRLGELGILPKIARISSVSGGSIAAGLLAKAWQHLHFDQEGIADAQSLQEHFLSPLLRATARSLDIRVSIVGLMPSISAGNYLADLYDRFFFDGMMMADLPDQPRFVFNATNIQTLGLFRFTKRYVADWRALKATTKTIRVADGVAASSAFPPLLAPLRLDLRSEDASVPKGARFNDIDLLKQPVLLDGGVYDNLGLEPIWKRCGVLIASYAGHNTEAQSSRFIYGHIRPMIYAFLASSIDQRERLLVGLYRNTLDDKLGERIGAYWSAGTEIDAYPKTNGWKPDPEILRRAKLTSTRLAALKRNQQVDVITAGYAYADRAIRSYLLENAPPPQGPPDIG